MLSGSLPLAEIVKVVPSRGRRKHCKVCSGGKKSALSGKSERRVAWPPPHRRRHRDTIGFLFNKVEWPPWKEGWLVEGAHLALSRLKATKKTKEEAKGGFHPSPVITHSTSNYSHKRRTGHDLKLSLNQDRMEERRNNLVGRRHN